MKTMISLLAASLFFAGTAMAQTTAPAHNHGQMDHGKMNHGAMKMDAKPDEFTTLDTDKNGTLSKAELAKHRLGPHFGMLDANKDGRLSPKEFAAGKGM